MEKILNQQESRDEAEVKRLSVETGEFEPWWS